MCGFIPIWGNILVYLASYLRQHDETIIISDVFIMYPVNIFMGACFMQLGSKLIGKIDPKIQLLIGGFTFSTSLFLMSLTSNYYVFFFLFSFMNSFGFGMVYMLPVRNAWLFYPRKKGMVSGLILSCYSIGAILWTFQTTYLVNSENELPTQKIQNGLETEILFGSESYVVQNVPNMLRQISFIYFSLVFVAVLCISKKHDHETDQDQPLLSQYEVTEPLINDQSTMNTDSLLHSSLIADRKRNQTIIQYKSCYLPPLRKQSLSNSVKQLLFWHLFAMLTLSISFSYFMKPSLKSYGSTKFNDDIYLTIVGAVAFLFSAFAKFGWGTAQDYLGFKKVYLMVLAIQILCCLSLNSVADQKDLYLIWIVFIFLCEGAHFVIFPALASDIYGSSLGARIYSLLFFGNATGACLGIVSSKFLLPQIGYEGVFIIYGVLSIISALLLFAFNKKEGVKRK
eukprot:403376433